MKTADVRQALAEIEQRKDKERELYNRTLAVLDNLVIAVQLMCEHEHRQSGTDAAGKTILVCTVCNKAL